MLNKEVDLIGAAVRKRVEKIKSDKPVELNRTEKSALAREDVNHTRLFAGFVKKGQQLEKAHAEKLRTGATIDLLLQEKGLKTAVGSHSTSLKK